jgi:predicted acyl esterase
MKDADMSDTSDAKSITALFDGMPEPVYADGMRILWDAPIPMSDGIVLRADIFLPENPGEYAAILSYGAYGKGVPMQVGYKSAYDRMVRAYPDIAEGSTNKYMNWEVADPEKWVPDGFVCIRVDSRGAGRSPGVLDATSEQETRDIYECIEWAAAQPWSNGKIGMNGISYYATNQWYVAALRPPHLAAICVWEGFVDRYRDAARHGGILSQFGAGWFGRQVLKIQHGYGERGIRNPNNGEWVSGPETLSEEELAANRAVPMVDAVYEHPLDDEFYAGRRPDLSRIEVPVLSAANWGGMGVHPRGNFEGYLEAGSRQKWLEVHGDSHFSPFYRKEGLDLQKKFLGHFLQGKDTGWDRQPPVQLQIRRPGEHFTVRDEQEWPLARTQWTKFYLDPAMQSLSRTPSAGSAISYDTMGDGVTFTLPPATAEMEITGPVAARLVVSSQTADADLFVALRLFAPDGKEVLFIGSNDPRVPIALGWLRASHRKLDTAKSLPYRPYHTHDELQPLVPGEPVVLDIEILPTSIVVPAGYTLALNIRGCDYNHGLGDAGFSDQPYPMTGVGPFRHEDPRDRPPEIFDGKNTLHFEAGNEPFLLLPIIPSNDG